MPNISPYAYTSLVCPFVDEHWHYSALLFWWTFTKRKRFILLTVLWVSVHDSTHWFEPVVAHSESAGQVKAVHCMWLVCDREKRGEGSPPEEKVSNIWTHFISNLQGGYFHLLAFVIKVAMNTSIQNFMYLIFIFFCKFLRVKFLNRMVILGFIFLSNH